MQRLLIIAVAAIGLLLAGTTSSHARSPSGYGGGLFFGGGFGSTTIWDLYRSGRIPVPPYFALNPPVYYSYPVPRTYGYSPWPYPGDVRTPDPLAAVEPLQITNPYFDSSTSRPSGAAAATPEQTVKADSSHRGPLTITNPYVDQTPAILQVAH
ncbi:MAG: hypothetical protein AAF790_02900 [Planctomycetota bacterium]